MVFGNARYVRSGDLALPFLRGPDFKNLDPPRITAIPGVTLDVVVTEAAVVSSPPPSALNQIAQQAAQFPKYDPLSALQSHPWTPTSHFTTGNNVPRTFNNHRAPVPLTLRRQPNDTATRTHKRALELNQVKAIIRKIAVCTDLDALHAKGDGRPQDFRKALECYLKTVQKGQAQALISVGDVFLNGQAVQQNPTIAMGWYLKAAYLGDNNARYKIDQLRLELPRLFSSSRAPLLQGSKDAQQDKHRDKVTAENVSLGASIITAEGLASSSSRNNSSAKQEKVELQKQVLVNYQDNSAKWFLRVLDSVGGSFIENVGRVEVRLGSRVLAERFFSALGKARSVYELDIDLDWACTTSDLEALEYALKTSSVSILRLDLRRFRMNLTSNLLSTPTQYDVILRIRGLSTMKVLHIIFSMEHVDFLRFPLKTSLTACEMSCELALRSIEGKEIEKLAEALKTNSILTTLNLRMSSIGDDRSKALAEVLKANSALTTLDLQSNTITDEGARALAGIIKTNSALTTLNLKLNKIGDDGAKALAEAIKTSSTMTTLSLEYNSIGDDGAKALAAALKTSSTITTLNLSHNKIGSDGAEALAKALETSSTITTLKLGYNKIGYDGAKALTEALMTNSALTTLILGGNSIGSNGARAMAEVLNTNLAITTLNLWRNKIGPYGAKALAEALKTNSALTTLNLGGNKLGSNGASALAEALKTNSALTNLDLGVNSIRYDGVKALAEALKTHSALTTLNLGCNSIGDNGAKALADALKTNSALTTLDLGVNNIGSIGASALAEALKTNSALTTLNLGCNSIGDDGAKALTAALKTNSALTTLNMYHNKIGEDGAKALAEILKTNSIILR